MKSGLVKVRLNTETIVDLTCSIENGKVVKIFAHGKELKILTGNQHVYYRNAWHPYWLLAETAKAESFPDLPTIK